MNPALLKALVASAPALMLLVGSIALFIRGRNISLLFQLIGAACMVLVVFTHVCEALHWLSAMQWGDEHSIGHYVDLSSALIALTLFPIGYFLHAVRKWH